MSGKEDVLCTMKDIKEIIKDPIKYFREGIKYEIIEIGTNISILLKIKNPNIFQKKIIDYLSNYFSHQYISIKININNEIKNYSIGLAEDCDRKHNYNGYINNKTQLYIPDWSVYSEYSEFTTGSKKIQKLKARDIFKGRCKLCDKLTSEQAKYLQDIHKLLENNEYITNNGKEYRLIDTPFLYYHFGYYFSYKITNKNILNCRDFVYFFLNDIKFLKNISFMKDENSEKYNIEKIENNWVLIQRAASI